MHGSTLILLLALVGQPPVAVGPAYPSPVVSKPGQVVEHWIDATSPIDGHPIRILGWVDAQGVARFDPAKYPQFVPATSPAPYHPTTSATNSPRSPSPTGVVLAKFPTVSAGHAWTGGNVPVAIGANPASIKQPPDVYVTIIGAKREREKAKASLLKDPEFAAMAKEMGPRLAVECYDPTNPLVADVGLVAQGRPDIVVMDSTGGEVDRFADFPGPKPVLEAVRKANPQYTPGGPKVPPSSSTIGAGWVVAGGVALLFIGLAALRKAPQ